MKIVPNQDLLLVERIENSQLSQDIIIQEQEEDKNLVVVKVVKWTETYKPDSMVIVWRYSLYRLVYKWLDYYFVDESDVVGEIED
jgi:hypothetical protein